MIVPKGGPQVNQLTQQGRIEVVVKKQGGGSVAKADLGTGVGTATVPGELPCKAYSGILPRKIFTRSK